MMDIVKNLVSSSLYYCKCPYSMNPTRIVVHNTPMTLVLEMKFST